VERWNQRSRSVLSRPLVGTSTACRCLESAWVTSRLSTIYWPATFSVFTGPSTDLDSSKRELRLVIY